MTNDCVEICDAADAYFEALHQGDADRLSSLFLSESHLYASSDGRLQVMPIADYLDLVANRPSPESQGHLCSGKVVSIDMAGPNSAVAKVTVALPPMTFIDLLSFMKIEGRWRIISKVYHASTS